LWAPQSGIVLPEGQPEGQPASALEATPLGATCVYSSVVAIDGCLGGVGLALLEGVAPLLRAHGKSGSMGAGTGGIPELVAEQSE
jgi:hypothetical protein